MEKKRSEKADAEVDKDRVVMLLMKNGSMTIDDLTGMQNFSSLNFTRIKNILRGIPRYIQ